MDIICTDVVLHEVIGEFLRHSFGQCGDQNSLVFLDALLYFFHQVVHLVQAWAHFDDGVEQAGRADNLLHYDSFALLQFIVSGSGGYINDLSGQLLELLEFQKGGCPWRPEAGNRIPPSSFCGRGRRRTWH